MWPSLQQPFPRWQHCLFFPALGEKSSYLFCATYLGKTHFSLLWKWIIVFLETKKESLSGSKPWLKKLSKFPLQSRKKGYFYSKWVVHFESFCALKIVCICVYACVCVCVCMWDSDRERQNLNNFPRTSPPLGASQVAQMVKNLPAMLETNCFK